MGEFMHFHDRCDAGAQLARQLQAFHGDRQALVLALPRGGVPVAFVVAAALDLPLDVLVVRKLGVPGQPEYAMGAVASGARILHQPVIEQLRIPAHAVEQAVIRETLELERREALYRAGRAPLQLEGRHVLLVDDGLATGATMRAAVRVVKQQHPAQLVVAVPVAAPDTRDALASEVDQVVCLHAPLRFQSVSQWYRDFPQTTDAEVLELLHTAAQRRTGEAETGKARQPSPESQIATQFLR
jgi:putative phosphoribosyl transferase